VTRLRVAVVQMNAGPEVVPNLRAAIDFGRRARAAGADLIAYPENLGFMVKGRERIVERARTEGEHPARTALAELARETGAFVLGGTIAVTTDDGRLANRSLLFASDGRIVGRYDKIHLYDADLPGGESYRESATFRPGERAVVAPTPWGGLGMTVCYDVRFPHLHRELARAGAVMLTVPAAFTVPTGSAHWHVLLRARAIETGCFVVAPAQTGTHEGERRTYGHSLIVDPWGEVLTDAGEEPGFVVAEIDTDRVTEARTRIPALSHDRPFEPPSGV